MEDETISIVNFNKMSVNVKNKFIFNVITTIKL